MLMERKGHGSYEMCLRIYLRISDVLFGRVGVELRPSLVEQIVIVLLLDGDTCSAIRAEEQSLAGLRVDQQMFEMAVVGVGPGVEQKILSQ